MSAKATAATPNNSIIGLANESMITSRMAL